MEKEEKCCGNCATFSNEDANGVGWCDNKKKTRSCYQFCKEHKLKQEREVNMKEEYIAQIAKELNEYMDWMKDSSAVNADTLDELIEYSGDIYEAVLDIHLINGDVVTLQNECLISFDEKRYMGANVVIDLNNGNIIADISVVIPYYRSIKIPLTSICWIDSHTENVNWEKYKRRKEIEGITGMRFESYK